LPEYVLVVARLLWVFAWSCRVSEGPLCGYEMCYIGVGGFLAWHPAFLFGFVLGARMFLLIVDIFKLCPRFLCVFVKCLWVSGGLE